ncbi:MAG TPA: galactose oxidase-like domain-containing protein, partial [Candidatus Caenarcaniphilales bacterium]
NSNYGNRYYGSAVMYDEGKVLLVGGSNTKYGPPTKTAEVIDLYKGSPPRWIPVGSMANARRHHNLTLLADGKVLATGGTSSDSFNNTSGRILAAEMWDPATANWSTMASMQVTRTYHSTAVLLPDGRVLMAGGGLPAGNGDPNDPQTKQGNYNAEIYSPPYLFKGGRPTISSAPGSVGYGQQFFVGTPNAASISQVNWIRLSSTTHQFNANQRLNRLSFTKTSTGLNITTPADRNLAPPGHYMLFILNNGVPSVAKIIQIS